MSAISGTGIVSNSLVLNLDASNILSYDPTLFIGVRDVTNLKNTCTSTGGVTVTLVSDRSAPNYFTFDGTSGYLLASAPDLPTGTSAKTILCWCWPDSTLTPTDTYTGLVGYGGRSSSNATLLSMQTTGATWYVSSAYWSNDYVPGSTVVINKNAWNMIGIIHQGTNTVNNTTLIVGNSSGVTTITGSSSSSATVMTQTSQNLTIGCTDVPGRYMKGRISQVLMYNRALTVAEVTQNFNARRASFGL
jgi:hypothetical protein